MPGMGGGMMGGLLHSMMGGRNSGTAPQPTAPSQPDVYDVDRWKRADDLDQTTMVQAVRRDWEQKQGQKKPFKQKVKAFFHKDTDQKAETIPDQTESAGTIVMPEMQAAQRRIKTDAGEEAAPLQAAAPRRSHRQETNYLGLTFPTALDGFFTSNPLNSAILAVDQLGLGPLSLNQVTGCPSKARHENPTAQPNRDAGPAPETNCMTALRESREQQKYKVRIVE